MKKITVVIPCHNEADGIENVINGFPLSKLKKLDYSLEIIVVDNNSKDKTAEIARKAGAKVVFEPKRGKGNAMKTGFKNISADTDYVVMIDGDDSYRPEEIVRLVAPIHDEFADVVIGSRLGGKIHGDSMSLFNRVGNWIFTHLVRQVYRANVTDVLTGYFAWRKNVIDELFPHLTSNGFAIEMEMITRMARMDVDLTSVPISYHSRAGESNLRPIHDGARILKMFFNNLWWRPKRIDNVISANQYKPLNIAFVSDAIYPYNKGGKEKRLYEITKRLVEKGHEVHIYTMKWWDGPKDRIENGVHLHAISKLHPLYRGNTRSIKQGLLFGLSCFKLFRKKFDLVDVDHMPFFPLYSIWLVCLLRRKKMYATWHEVWGRSYWKEYMGWRGNIAAMIEKVSILLPHQITSVSEHTSDSIKQDLNRSKNLTTILSGVGIKEINSARPAQDSVDILCVARLMKHKNIDLLIKSVAKVKVSNPNVKCVIIGKGPEIENLLKLVKKLRLQRNIEFIEYLEKSNDVYGYMKSAKVFVLPSEREGFGIVVIEAMACNTPVITINSPANAARHLVSNGVTGSVVLKSATNIADAINEWLSSPANDKVKNHVKKHDWQPVTDLVLDSYQT